MARHSATMNSALTVCVALVATALLGAPAVRGTTNTFSVAGAKPAHAKTFHDQKIIGGLKMGILNFPFMAPISMQSGKTVALQCGSSILDANHVLTAAHCFDNRNTKVYQVRAGSNYWRYQGQLSGIAKIMIHPKYNGSNFDNDVAVVRLSKPFKLGPTVKPVSLVPVKTAIKVDTPLYLIGWGYTDPLHEGGTSGVLRAVTVPSISNSECELDYQDYGLTVTSRMFCGMGQEKDSCQGDSGGPVINQSTGKQAGIISWGMGCAQMGSPGVYANVADPGIRSFITASLKQ